MFAACASMDPAQRSARAIEKRRGLREMEKAKRYEIEGRILDIPVHWDERSQQYLEDYSSLIENPVYTPEGRPILLTIEDACPQAHMADHPVYTPEGERVMLTIEDACAYGEAADGTRCIDCGSCVYFRQPRGSLLGVCHNEKTRSGAKLIQVKTNEKEETR